MLLKETLVMMKCMDGKTVHVNTVNNTVNNNKNIGLIASKIALKKFDEAKE